MNFEAFREFSFSKISKGMVNIGDMRTFDIEKNNRCVFVMGLCDV